MRRRGRPPCAPRRGPAGGRALVGAFRGLGAAAIGALLWPALTVPFVPAGRAALADAVVHQHRLVVDTLVLALVTALAGTIGGALTAGVHHHFRFRGRGLLHLMLLSPLLLPPVAPAIALLELWGHNGFATRLLGWRSVPVYGFTGLVIAEVMTLLPLAHLMTLVGLSNLDGSLTDQARDMGASEARVLARIVLPGMRGALAGVFLLLVAHATVDIANPLALGGSYPVLSTRLREAAAGEDDMTAAGAYGLILLVICALAALAMPGRDHRPFQERLRRRRRVRRGPGRPGAPRGPSTRRPPPGPGRAGHARRRPGRGGQRVVPGHPVRRRRHALPRDAHHHRRRGRAARPGERPGDDDRRPAGAARRLRHRARRPAASAGRPGRRGPDVRRRQ